MNTTSPRGNVGGANPASFTTTYAHNNFGQVTETVDPLGHKTTSQYGPDENVIASTDGNGNTTTYTYDAADEQTATHRADGTTTQTTYWPDGTVKEQIDGAAHVTLYEYDPLGRVSAVTDPAANASRTTTTTVPATRRGHRPAGPGHDEHLRRCKRADCGHIQRRENAQRNQHHLRRRRPAHRHDRRHRNVVLELGLATPPHKVRPMGRQRRSTTSTTSATCPPKSLIRAGWRSRANTTPPAA